MDWDKLRVFHAVAEAGSFTHAGETLHLSQSAVSRQISALEEKVRALEMVTRNAVTNESVERQFSRVMDQTRRVDRLAGTAWTDGTPDH